VQLSECEKHSGSCIFFGKSGICKKIRETKDIIFKGGTQMQGMSSTVFESNLTL
jgi:hypothetical protein